MAFIETPRFPDSISYGSRGGPLYNTTVIPLFSGHESRNQNWSQSRHKYDASFGIRTQNDLYEVLKFFHAMTGRTHAFRYKDHMDFKSGSPTTAITSLDQQIGIGNNIEVNFQIIKTYTTGSQSYIRTINKPISGTVLIAVNSITKVEGIGNDYVINYATGIVTFNVAPANTLVISAGYEFDVPCRFQNDELPLSLDAFEVGNTSIDIMEIRV